MNVKLVSLASVLIALFLLAPLVSAGTTVNLTPVDGYDSTPLLNPWCNYNLASTPAIGEVSISDDSRFSVASYTSCGSWVADHSGWPRKYNQEILQFDFAGSILPGTPIKSVMLNLEVQKSTDEHRPQARARVRVNDGSSWTSLPNSFNPFPSGPEPAGIDFVYSYNVSSILNTPTKISSASIEYKARGRRLFGPVLKTSHDLVELAVYYNYAPIANETSITPNPAYTTDDLTADYDYYDGDGDAETGSIIDWHVNSVKVHTGTTLDSTLFVKGDVIYFVITPFDGEDYGAPVTSSSITIQNTPPVITVDSPNGGEIWSGWHEVNWTASDIDGDTLTIDLEYNTAGNPWAVMIAGIGNNGSNYWDTTTSVYGDDNTYLIRATADDGEDTASNESDDVFTVDNTAPVTTLTAPAPVYSNAGVDWYNAGITATLTAVDWPAGFNYMTCSVDAADCSSASNPNSVPISIEGVNLLTWRSQDNADPANVEAPQYAQIGIDTTAPNTPANLASPDWVNTPNIPVDWNEATDVGGSGVCGYNLYLNGSLEAYLPGESNTNYLFTNGMDGNQYDFQVAAVDCVNWESTWSNIKTTGVDFNAPSTPWLVRTSRYWTNIDAVDLTWNTSIDDYSGVVTYNLYRGDVNFPGSVGSTSFYDFVNAPTTIYTDASAKTDDWKYIYQVTAVDNASNEGDKSNRRRAVADFTNPNSWTAMVVGPGAIGSNGWYTNIVAVDISSTDATSGVKFIRWSVNSGPVATVNVNAPNNGGVGTTQAPIASEGYNVLAYQARDRALNWETEQYLNVNIDWTAPDAPTGLTANGLSNPGLQLTNNPDYELEWDATNDSVSGTWYYTVYRDGSALDNSTVKSYDETAPGEGTYCYEATQTDYAGHESAASAAYCVTVDLTAPNMTGAITRTYTTIDLFFDEDLNGPALNTNDFIVENNTVASVTEFNGTVTLTLGTPIGGDDTPWIAINPQQPQQPTCVEDLAGNIQDTGNVTAADGIAPAFVSITPDKPYYVPEDLITLTVVMDLPNYLLWADFTAIDSEFVNGSENVTANGSIYTITYALNENNTRGGSLSTGYYPTVYAQDAALNNASDNSTKLRYDVSTAGELTKEYSIEGNYDVVAGGIGLRPDPADRNVTVNAPGAITKAFLYWQTMGTPTVADANITIDGTEVTGTTIGNSWLTLGDNDHNRTTFRADVTALAVQGNYSYEITGETNNIEGAALVIVYETNGPNAFIQINDGCGNPRLNVSTEFNGFTAWPGYTAGLWLIGGGSSTTANIESYFNEALLSANSWNNSDGKEWDTDYFEVTALANEGDSSATARVYGYNSESMKWAAAVIKVIGEEPAKATPNSGGGGVNSHDVYLPAARSYQPPEEPAPAEEPNDEPLHLQAPSYARIGSTVEVLATDEDGNPLAGATVYLNAGGYYTTDENGVISFVAKEEGWTKYTAYKAGYYQAEDAKSYFRKAAFYDIGSIPEVEGETLVEPLTPGPATGLFTAVNAPWLGLLVLILLGGGYYAWRTRLAG